MCDTNIRHKNTCSVGYTQSNTQHTFLSNTHTNTSSPNSIHLGLNKADRSTSVSNTGLLCCTETVTWVYVYYTVSIPLHGHTQLKSHAYKQNQTHKHTHTKIIIIIKDTNTPPPSMEIWTTSHTPPPYTRHQTHLSEGELSDEEEWQHHMPGCEMCCLVR